MSLETETDFIVTWYSRVVSHLRHDDVAKKAIFGLSVINILPLGMKHISLDVSTSITGLLPVETKPLLKRIYVAFHLMAVECISCSSY